MPDLSINNSEVYRISGREVSGVSGQAINAGQVVAYDSGKYYLADNDSGTPARKTISGIALETVAASDEPLRIQKSGVIYIAALLTVGQRYFVSSTPGNMCPYADLTSGDDIILVGVGGSPSIIPKQYVLTLAMKDFNVAIP